MDEPNTNSPGDPYEEASTSEILPVGISQGTDKESPNSGTTPQYKGNTPYQKAKDYFGQLLREKPDRHIELILAFAIAFLALAQLISSCHSSSSAGHQTQQLITAAGISAQAARDNVLASRNFAESARGINQGVEDAVSKLRAEANATETARETSDDNSRTALQATINNFHQEQRPWISLRGLNCKECSFFIEPITQLLTPRPETLSLPNGLTSELVNSGRTPALHVHIETISAVQEINMLRPEVPSWNSVISDWDAREAVVSRALGETPSKPEYFMGTVGFGGYTRVGLPEMSIAPSIPVPLTLIDSQKLVRQYPDLREGGAWMDVAFVLGRITYTDSTMRESKIPPYSTIFCFWNIGWHPEDFAPCPTGNDIK